MPQYFDPMQSMNALAGGAQMGGAIRDKQTSNALAPMVAKGDYKGAMEYAGSRGDLGQVQDMRKQYEAQVANLDEKTKAAERKRIEGLARIAYGGRQYDDEGLNDYVRGKAPELLQLGITQEQVAGMVHNGVTRQNLEEFITGLTPIEEFWKQQDPYTLSADQVRFGGNNQEVARGPAKPAPEPDQATDALGRRRYATGENTGEIVPGFDSQTPQTGDDGSLDFGEIFRVREGNEKRYQAFETAQRNYLTMSELAKDGTGAADVALGFAFFKTIDPTSTVREGEFAQAATAMGLGGQVVSIFKRLDNGEKFTPQLRSDLVSAAGRAYQQQSQDIQALDAREKTFAGQMNIDPSLVTRDPVRTASPKPSPMSGPPPQGAVQDLMSDLSPESVAEFNEIFGEGAAEKALQSMIKGAR
jgi:hypothetical protein